MPQVPIYSQQVKPSAGPTSMTPFSSNASPDAFGVGKDAAAAELGEAISKTGDIIFQRSLEHQQDYNKSRVIEADTRFRNMIQDSLYSTQVDDQGVPKGYLNRTQSQAIGSTSDYDQKMFERLNDFSKELENPAQQQAFVINSMQHLQAVRGTVIANEAKQKDNWDWSTFKANGAQRIADSSLYAQSPVVFNQFLNDSKNKAADFLRSKGADQSAINFETQLHAADLTKSAVNSLLDTNPKKAQDILNSAKGAMSESAAADLQRTIDGKLFYDKVQSNVSRAMQYRNSDGTTFDLSKVHDDIYKQPGTFEEKAKQYSEVATRLKGIEIDSTRAEASNVLKMSNDGLALGSYDKAMKLVPQQQYGLSPLKQNQMQDFFKKAFTEPDPPTTPEVYNKFADSIRSGNFPTAKSVDDAWKNRTIKLSDRNHFLDEISKQNDKDHKANFDSSHDAVKVFADEKFPYAEDKLEKEKFIYQLDSEALRLKIKDPGQLRKLGDDLYKPKPVPRGWLGNLMVEATKNLPDSFRLSPTKDGPRRYSQDYDTQKDQDLGKAKYGLSMGNAIAEKLGQNRIDQLVTDLDPAGNNLFGVGNAGNNALQSLISANYRPEKINSENIKAILKKWPDGMVPQNIINKWRSGK